MPADPAIVPRATRAAQIVTRADPSLLATYPGARDGLTTPSPGYFENAADAAAALELVAALIGRFRRRFLVNIAEEHEVDPATGIPTFRLIDDELGVDTPAVLTRMQIDMERETSTFEVMG